MKKRVVALMLTAGMVFSCLTGCGQEGQQEVSKGTSTSEESSQTSESDQKETEKVEEVTTVTWAISGDPQEDDEKVLEEMNKLLRERYNLELNLLAIPGGEYNERMRMMITGGEDFDLCFTANWSNNFYDNVNQGAFLALNDLLESEVGTELMEVYPEGLYNVATVGGEIYALPNYQMICNQGGAYVQKELADKYGLKPDAEIKDITDLEWFMDKIRDNEKDYYVVRHSMNFESSLAALATYD
ncbi:MAG: extracellular solute-binding protein, partial [Eubacterium sp.]|nr:extracellular solute-binding protein [Eubacterium sp.]